MNTLRTVKILTVAAVTCNLLLPGLLRCEPFQGNPKFDREITMSFRKADVADVFKAFSQDYGISLVIEDGIEGEITAHFEQTTVGDALDAIVSMAGCGWEQRGGIILVFHSRPISKVFGLDYTLSDSFRAELEGLLSDGGRIVFDPASSGIMVIDAPANVKRIESYLALADPDRQQVMIEASIVEVSLGKDDEMGVDWNRIDYSLLNADGVTGEITQSLAPGASTGTDQQTGWDGFQFAVSHERGSALLRAIATNTNMDLLSAPKIATLNNQKAVIKVTERVPYIKTSTDIAEAGFISTKEETEFEEVGIILEATPQISADGSVFLSIRPEISEVTSWFNGQPVVDSRSVETTIKVGDGQTVIIGGLLRDGVTQTINKVPLLGDIPGLGLLLRSKREVQTKTELLILITPRIVDAGALSQEARTRDAALDRMRDSIRTGLLR